MGSNGDYSRFNVYNQKYRLNEELWFDIGRSVILEKADGVGCNPDRKLLHTILMRRESVTTLFLFKKIIK